MRNFFLNQFYTNMRGGGQRNLNLILDNIYPVGSIHLTIGDYNPSQYFGGNWQKLYGGYLYAAKNSISKTDYMGWGTQSHTLTAAQSGLRSHTHDMSDDVYGGYVNQMGVRGDGGGGSHWTPSYAQTNSYSKYKPGYTGGWNAEQGHTHNIATVDVYVWKRIS